MSARQWYKVHSSWWTSPSHAHMGAMTLGFGLFLVWVADRDPEWRERGSARLMNGDGTPMTVAQIAKVARERQDSVRRVTLELQASGTLVTDESHYLCFPNFAKWQQSPSARRMSRVRKGEQVTGEEKRTEENRGESDSRAGARAPKLDLYGGAARRVLARLSDRRQEVVPGSRPLAPTKSNLKEIAARLAEGEPEDLLLSVVDAAAEEARGKPDRYRWLNSTTPFRVSNLARYAALADTACSTKVATAEEAEAHFERYGELPAGWTRKWNNEVVPA